MDDHIKFTFRHTACIPDQELEKLYAQLQPERERVHTAQKDTLYHDPYSCLYTPFDQSVLNKVLALAEEKKKLQPALVLLVGIGGSNLGALAVHQALQGLLYNDLQHTPAFYCADTIDAASLHDLLSIAQHTLKHGHELLLIIVSKSGTTLETMVNAAFFIELLKKYRTEYQRSIVIITNEHSPLADHALEHGFDCLIIPHAVGGRYSVFTTAGLFPLAMLNNDIRALCSGASEASLKDAAYSACILYYHWCQGIAIHDVFLFSPRLALVGAWYRQLMGESIGKQYNTAGAKVEVGITPTVSIGTTDLHSVGQLYLGGPRDKITTFVIIKKEAITSSVPANKDIPLPSFAYGKDVTTIKDAIWHGVAVAYQQDRRPFTTLELTALTPATLGALLYFNMAQMIYLGFLLQVNPFDQPAVESYKKEAIRALGEER
jgi:glucose-6-phosphate isomerase